MTHHSSQVSADLIWEIAREFYFSWRDEGRGIEQEEWAGRHCWKLEADDGVEI
jgi:hypothetical protein